MATILLALCASCSNAIHTRGVRAALARAEALMETDPDSARAVLDSLQTVSFTSSYRKYLAHYALLRTQAEDKCQHRLTTDTLIRVAADYYGTKRKTLHAALAQHYLGCAYKDMGRDMEALDAFLRAAALFPDTTCKYYAYGQYSIGQLYLNHGREADALSAFRHYRWSEACTSDSVNIGYGDMFMGMSYLYMEQAAEAKPFFLSVMANPHMSEAYRDNARFQLAKLYAFLEDDFEKARPYIEHYIAHYDHKERIGAAYYLKGELHRHEGVLDSAYYYYNKVLTCEKDIPTFHSTYRRLMEVSPMLGRNDSISTHLQLYAALSDSIYRMHMDREISDIQNRHKVELHDREQAARQSRFRWTWGILSALLLLLVTIVLLLHDRSRKAERLRYEAALTAIRQCSIRQTVFDNELETEELSDTAWSPPPATFKCSVQEERQKLYLAQYESGEWAHYFQKHQSDIKAKKYMPESDAVQFEAYLDNLFVDMEVDMVRENSRLADLDIQLCAMTLLGFKTKQISYVCRLSADAVYMRRSRLKQRLTDDWSNFVFSDPAPQS